MLVVAGGMFWHGKDKKNKQTEKGDKVKQTRWMFLAVISLGGALLLGWAVVPTVLATGSNDCAGVTNESEISQDPCVKVQYYLESTPWNIWCNLGTSGRCQDGTDPGFDTTKKTYNPCTAYPVSSNGGRPKSKVCN